MAASWHVAPSVKLVIAEVDAAFPGRSRSTDGTIGNPEHAARESDHNPNSRRSVNAADITSISIDAMFVIAKMCADPRTNYVIHKRTIWSRSRNFVPRPYYGPNAHNTHIHISILQAAWAENDVSSWGIVRLGSGVTPPVVRPGLPSTGAEGPVTNPPKEDTLSSAEAAELKTQIAELRGVVMSQTVAIANNGFARPVRDAMSLETAALVASTGFNRAIIERNAEAVVRQMTVVLDAKFNALSALLAELEKNDGINDAQLASIVTDVEESTFKASKAGIEAGVETLSANLSVALNDVLGDLVFDMGKDLKPEQLAEITENVVATITSRLNADKEA